jgi:hypothetical protein
VKDGVHPVADLLKPFQVAEVCLHDFAKVLDRLRVVLGADHQTQCVFPGRMLSEVLANATGGAGNENSTRVGHL